ncbi:hypothetical protein ACROYT_G015127 [Oculina patagonica]
MSQASSTAPAVPQAPQVSCVVSYATMPSLQTSMAAVSSSSAVPARPVTSVSLHALLQPMINNAVQALRQIPQVPSSSVATSESSQSHASTLASSSQFPVPSVASTPVNFSKDCFSWSRIYEETLQEEVQELEDVAAYTFGCQTGLRASHQIREDPVLESDTAFLRQLLTNAKPVSDKGWVQ